MADDTLNPVHAAHIQRMQCWVADFIVDLNICPFAKREIANQSIRYCVSDARDDDAWYDEISAELDYLQQHPGVETTIMLLEA